MRLGMFESADEVYHHLLLETDPGRLRIHLLGQASHRCTPPLGSEVFLSKQPCQDLCSTYPRGPLRPRAAAKERSGDRTKVCEVSDSACGSSGRTDQRTLRFPRG